MRDLPCRPGQPANDTEFRVEDVYGLQRVRSRAMMKSVRPTAWKSCRLSTLRKGSSSMPVDGLLLCPDNLTFAYILLVQNHVRDCRPSSQHDGLNSVLPVLAGVIRAQPAIPSGSVHQVDKVVLGDVCRHHAIQTDNLTRKESFMYCEASLPISSGVVPLVPAVRPEDTVNLWVPEDLSYRTLVTTKQLGSEAHVLRMPARLERDAIVNRACENQSPARCRSVKYLTETVFREPYPYG